MSLPLLNKILAVTMIFLFASGQNLALAAPKREAKFPARLMALQFPSPEMLARSFRFSNKEAQSMLLRVRKQAVKKLALVGFNANISLDKAVDESLPILSIYPAKIGGINPLSKGYALEAAITQYGRRTTGGPVVCTYRKRIGTSPVVCFTLDFENYALMLVDVYVQIHIHADEYKKKQNALKGGKKN